MSLQNSPSISPIKIQKRYSPSSVAISRASGTPIKSQNILLQNINQYHQKQILSPQPKKNKFKPPKVISTSISPKVQMPIQKIQIPSNQIFFNISSLDKIERLTLHDFSIFHGNPNQTGDISFLPKDAEEFRFENGSGYADAFVSLIEKGFDPLLLKPKWVKNHYKWIVWKLRNLDLSYPKLTPLLTFDNVVKELKYRAQLEILDAKRSSVRLLYERDGPPNAFIILMVSDILPDGCLELTDGWYSIPTTIDILLANLVKEKKIQIGMKLRICCAQFDGDDASDPLDDDRSTKLILRMNSVRHARWDSQLGYQKVSLFPVNLASLAKNGGPLPYIEVIVQKKYPFLFKEVSKDESKPGIIRTRSEQTTYEQKRENDLAEEIEKLRNDWLKELRKNGTDVENSYPIIKEYLCCNDKNEFLSSFSGENKKELLCLLEKHQNQVDEFLRVKSEEYISSNASEFITFFNLLVTDLCPHLHNDAEIVFWRMPPEVYDEIKEGMAIRIFHLETSEMRSDYLLSKDQSKIAKIEPQPLHASTIYRPRKLLYRFSDIFFYANEMKLPTGTEFDFIGFLLEINSNTCFFSDGSSVIIAIDFRTNTKIKQIGVAYLIENARYQNIDFKQGVAHFSGFDTTTVARTPYPSIKNQWLSIQKLKEFMNFSPFSHRVQKLISGQMVQVAYKSISNISPLSFLSNTTVIASISDFDKIDCLYNKNGKSVMILGNIFQNNIWKTKYIESREEFDIGLNMILKITDGIGCRIVHITPIVIDQFFSTIGTMISAEQSRLVTNFFKKYFIDDGSELHSLRINLMNRYMLDVTNVQTMLRASLFNCELIYNEKHILETMRKRKADLIFAFSEEEWKEFVMMLRNVLINIEFKFDLYNDGKIDEEGISIVSNISEIQVKETISHYIDLLR